MMNSTKLTFSRGAENAVCPWRTSERKVALHGGQSAVLAETLISANLRLPVHCHEPAIVCLVLTGGFRETYRNVERDSSAAGIALYTPEAKHNGRFANESTRLFSLNLLPSSLDPLTSRRLEEREKKRLAGTALPGLMLRMYLEFNQQEAGTDIFLQVEELIAEIIGMHLSKARPRWLQRAHDQVADTFRTTHSLAKLARDVQVHPSHLARAFRNAYGCTISQYIRRLRVQDAASRLLGSEQTLAAIATASGFSDQSHFSRVFRQTVGISPAAYRKLSA